MPDNDDENAALTIDIEQWISKAKADPKAYIERQATEIFLTALAITEPYNHEIYLKGGVLMGVVYESPRQTGDIDFTAIMEPDAGIADRIKDDLDASFPRAAAQLGYPDLLCRVQSSRYYPSKKMFPKADGPALKVKIAYAERGTRQEKSLEEGMAAHVLVVDISFREPVGAFQIVQLGEKGAHIKAYSLLDLMAEKLRALLQQEKRNRFRRQDIYDLDTLMGAFTLDEQERHALLNTLMMKSEARGIKPDRKSLSQPAIIKRAKEEWRTLELEIGELPDFDACFERVDAFYQALPWPNASDENGETTI